LLRETAGAELGVYGNMLTPVTTEAADDEQGLSDRPDAGAATPGLSSSARLASDGGSDSRSESFGQVAAAAIGVAGAGIGGLGFVVAVGGIVTQARFRGAGLPDEQAAALQAQGVLLDVGGRTLGFAALAALVLVAAVHWSEELSKALRRSTHALPARLREYARSWWTFYWLGVAVLLVDYLIWAGFQLRPGLQRGMLILMTVVALIGAAIVTQLARSARSHRSGSRAEALALLGLFVGAVLLGGGAAAAGNLARPQVRAAAVLLTNPRQVMCGLYVGQTNDRLYIGETVPLQGNPDLGDHGKGEIIEVALSRVTVLLIGSSEDLTSALARAEDFRDQLTAIAASAKLALAPAERTIGCEAPPLTHAPPSSRGRAS
jgi:hypothetical protein